MSTGGMNSIAASATGVGYSFETSCHDVSSVAPSAFAFWHRKALELPYLAALCKMLWSIPISSADSKRVFSAATRVIRRDRVSLDTDRANRLICLCTNARLNFRLEYGHYPEDKPTTSRHTVTRT